MIIRKILTMCLVATLCACGGSADTSLPAKVPANQYLAVGTSASDYRTVVQQLYIAYFGRPADTGGLTNFQSQLLGLGAPTDIQLLDAAYSSSAGVRSLINSFSDSAEAAALYSGDNTVYITAVYMNVLGRAPDAGGLAYWVGEVDSGRLTRARASFSIMAGALKNTTAQGLLDAQTVGNKVTIGTNFTAALIAAPKNGYSGDAAAARARTMLATVTSSTNTTTFQTTIDALVSALACDPYSTPPSPGSPPSC